MSNIINDVIITIGRYLARGDIKKLKSQVESQKKELALIIKHRDKLIISACDYTSDHPFQLFSLHLTLYGDDIFQGIYSSLEGVTSFIDASPYNTNMYDIAPVVIDSFSQQLSKQSLIL